MMTFPPRVSLTVRLFLISFAALFLELALIRWAPANVRMLAYYSNVMLISSFLGVGIGCLWKSESVWPESVLTLLVWVEMEIILALQTMAFAQGPDEMRYLPLAAPVWNGAALLAVFVVNTAAFVPFGRMMGRCFDEYEPRGSALKAYGVNLAGNILGVLLFGLFSFFHFSPAVAFLIPLGAMLLLHRSLKSFACSAALCGLIFFRLASTDPGGIWSPYQHLTVSKTEWAAPAGGGPTPIYTIQVNTDFYMLCATLDPARYADPAFILHQRDLYMSPYSGDSAPVERVLIVGSGGGMDVAAALAAGAGAVDAVEIDPEIIRLGRALHPDRPYDNPRVRVIQTDAREFFSRRHDRPYDRVIFGLLDSHILFSHMSNVRLDGFVYTVESFRSAYELLAEDGRLCVSFQTAGRVWIIRKIFQMLREATGRTPAAFTDGQGKHIFWVSKNGVLPEMRRADGGRTTFFPIPEENLVDEFVPSAVDDWPYLYLRDRVIPTDYLVTIFMMMGLAGFSIFVYPGVLRKKAGAGDADAVAGAAAEGALRAHFFFLGLSFMLLETKSITELSLLFGSTWLVSTIAILGVLIMIFASNAVASSFRAETRTGWMYVPLFASVLLIYFFPARAVLPMDGFAKILYALVLIPSPIFFSGIIFSATFRLSRAPAAALGANLIGSTLGGFAEYIGMTTGFRMLTFIVLAGYIASALILRSARQNAASRAH